MHLSLINIFKNTIFSKEFRAKIRLDPHIPDEDMEKIFLNLDEVLKLQLAVLGDFRKELLKR